jgi:hypothetical protein
MRTFKRPMFRKGGNVDNGIMTGIVDRTQAQDGYTGMEDIDIGTPKSQAEYIEEIKAGAGDYGGMDPLTSFLLTAGPSVAGATGFADAVNRLQPATKQLIEGADAKAKYDRDIRMAGTKLALADEQKFDDRRFNLALKSEDRSYQDFLRDDERKYLAGIKEDDRIYNKELIQDERKFNLDLIQDQRAYNKLEKEEKREYDAKILTEAREYNKMEKDEQRKYEERLIKEGRAFELEKIIRAEEFQKDLYNLEKEDAKKYTEKDFLEVYEGDTLQAKNRADFENNKSKTVFIEKFGSNFEGFLNGPNDPQESTMIKKGNNKKVGKVYYDVNTGEAKIYNKKTDGTYGFQIIDIDTYVKPDAPAGSTEAEKDAEIDKRFDYLSDRQRKILEEIKKNKPDETAA